MTIARKLYEKAWKDEYEEGILLGQLEATKAVRLEVKMEIARNMLEYGIDHRKVMYLTDLTENDLRNIPR